MGPRRSRYSCVAGRWPALLGVGSTWRGGGKRIGGSGEGMGILRYVPCHTFDFVSLFCMPLFENAFDYINCDTHIHFLKVVIHCSINPALGIF